MSSIEFDRMDISLVCIEEATVSYYLAYAAALIYSKSYICSVRSFE